MLRRIHSILLLIALLIGGARMNYVQAANVTLTVTASPAAVVGKRICMFGNFVRAVLIHE